MLIYFIILFFSIILHELGHLVMSLICNIKVYACSIGFGKILLHKKWKNIDWRISLIPLGGYCHIEDDINKPNNLYSISYFKQLLIMLSGVFVNIIIAFICYWINYKSITIGIKIDWVLLKAFIFKNDTLLYSILLSIYPINIIVLTCGFINSTLALVNLCPIPSLDGGYIWMLLIRKKLNEKIYNRIIIIGFVFMIVIQIILLGYFYLKGI